MIAAFKALLVKRPGTLTEKFPAKSAVIQLYYGHLLRIIAKLLLKIRSE